MHSTLKPFSLVSAVILALPRPTPVTTPSSTVAIDSSLLDQITCLFEASAGATIATKVCLFPINILRFSLSIVIPVTGINSGVTITVHDAFFPPSSEIAVITDSPEDSAEATPSVTVATELLLLDQYNVLFSALSGNTTASILWLSPTVNCKTSRLNTIDSTLTATGSSEQALKTAKTDKNNRIFFIVTLRLL